MSRDPWSRSRGGTPGGLKARRAPRERRFACHCDVGVAADGQAAGPEHGHHIGPLAGLLCPGISPSPLLSAQLVGTEDALLQQLADSMLKEDCASELKVHLANSLPLPSSVTRPRIDLIVFVINLHSKHSLRNVEESLHHVDATFFLGKVSFLVTGAGRESHCSIHRSTVVKLAHTYRSPLLFCDLEPSDLALCLPKHLVGTPHTCVFLFGARHG
ncbi:centromere protein M isoform X2 [Sus scrofa]|uniref:centromere protein M isoform X2 n=1 Tax=Sus scrofa TaxID=9823 RepID=UPI000A2B1EB1|nr:centromere protein M isoform X2 [Sus scrofa]